jgi:hypothetical protein
MTSLDMGLLELYVDDGFSLANRNRACVRTANLGHDPLGRHAADTKTRDHGSASRSMQRDA